MEIITEFINSTGFFLVTWQMVVMWFVCFLLFYLAIKKGFEPLLLIPIAFGALLANLPTQGLYNVLNHDEGGAITVVAEVEHADVKGNLKASSYPSDYNVEGTMKGEAEVVVQKLEAGLLDYISQGIRVEIFPPLIFLGVGALTDFGPLIANPRTLLLGGAAQLGIFMTFFGALALGFDVREAASIGIIGGADGPTSIFTANKLAPHLLAPIAVAAYTYMSLVPLIQPPIMRLLTSEDERKIRMKSLRQVSKLEKIVFCLLVTIVTILLVPAASALIGMLMFGNFLRECGVTERLLKCAQNELINLVTLFLGISVGITMAGEKFLNLQTIQIIVLGVVAFSFATAAGVVTAKVMNLISPKNPINPLIGSAGVSAVPMAARVSQVEGQKADPSNFLLMHAMGPNVAGVIGTAVAAGYFISLLAK